MIPRQWLSQPINQAAIKQPVVDRLLYRKLRGLQAYGDERSARESSYQSQRCDSATWFRLPLGFA